MLSTSSPLLRAAFSTTFAIFGAFTATAQTQPALKGIVQFNGANGSDPTSDLIQLPNGNFLGITLAPSFRPKAPNTIYELSATGVVKNLYQLAANGSQGALPVGYFPNDGLLQASDGNVYGVVNAGGASGYGLVYRFTLPGAFQILHNFGAGDGSPIGKLVQALDGALYGVTTYGGAYGAGDIFRIGLDGSYAIAYSFPATSQIGVFPFSGLATHPNGLLYGTLLMPGSGGGNIFQFDPATDEVQLLAIGPVSVSAPPVIAQDGGLYFLAPIWPCNQGGCGGYLVRYGTDGTGPQIEFSFSGAQLASSVSLMQASDGSFIGGGYSPSFQVNPMTQTFVSLPFPVGTSSGIVGNFVEGSSGNLVAAIPTVTGSSDLGALIAYVPKLPKPSPQVIGFYPASASVGSSVTVLGSYFVGSTAVAVNGIPATFSVKASGALVLSVPAGATTGSITISNQGGSVRTTGILTVQ